MKIEIKIDETQQLVDDRQFINEYRNNVRLRVSAAHLLLERYKDVPIGEKSAICIHVLMSLLESTEDCIRIIHTLMIKHDNKNESLWKIHGETEKLKKEYIKRIEKTLNSDESDFFVAIDLPFDEGKHDFSENKNFTKIIKYYMNDFSRFMKFVVYELQVSRKIILDNFDLRRTNIKRDDSGNHVFTKDENTGFFVNEILNNAKHGMKIFTNSEEGVISIIRFISQKNKKAMVNVTRLGLDYKSLKGLKHWMVKLTLALKNILDWYLFFHHPIGNPVEWLKSHPHFNFKQTPENWPLILDEDSYKELLEVDEKYWDTT